MDRAQIIEDLRDWLGDRLEEGRLLAPYEVIELLDQLEEEYE